MVHCGALVDDYEMFWVGLQTLYQAASGEKMDPGKLAGNFSSTCFCYLVAELGGYLFWSNE